MDKRIHFSLWYFLAALLVLIAIRDFVASSHIATLSYGQFKQAIKQNAVKDIVIANDRISGQAQIAFLKKSLPESKTLDTQTEWSEFITVRIADDDLIAELDAADIDYSGVIESTLLKAILSWVIPITIMLFVWQIVIGRMNTGGGMLSIGKSKAHIYVDKDIKVSFNDIAGYRFRNKVYVAANLRKYSHAAK